MSQGTSSARSKTRQSAKQSKALMARLTDAGEEALQRIAELPGGTRAVTAFNELRNRVDDLGKKVRGIDALEERIAKLEKQVSELRSQRRPPRKTSTTRPARRPSTPPTP